jgi:mono/diheme cytochrome c family protein
MRPLVVVAALALGGCAFEGTFEPPTPGLHRMVEQPRADAYEATDGFDDGKVMQRPPAGTVIYGARAEVDAPPFDRALVRSGRAPYETFCGPCHGLDGAGDTVVAEDMALRPPPSLLTARVRRRSDAALFRIATRGWGLMPGYDDALDARERWAVVAYLRALQLSRRAPIAALPLDAREEARDALRESGP